MSVFDHPEFSNHECISCFSDPDSGLKAIIAIHSSRGGFAGGGTRFFPYVNSEEALKDVLRLSRSMTYKSALAGLPFGGAKSVIIGDPKALKSEALLKAFGRCVDQLSGRYICAEDIGTTPEDMAVINQATPHVTGLPGKSGDTSPLTAYGVFRALQAAGDKTLRRKLASVAILGFGNVGRHLAEHLVEDGAEIFVADINRGNVQLAVDKYGAKAVGIEELFALKVDAIAPCSIGAVLNDRTIPTIVAPIVCGGANNQLADPAKHDRMLAERQVLFVPDYVANAGGVISGSAEVLNRSTGDTRQMVKDIYLTCQRVFDVAEEAGCTPLQAAEKVAEQILALP